MKRDNGLKSNIVFNYFKYFTATSRKIPIPKICRILSYPKDTHFWITKLLHSDLHYARSWSSQGCLGCTQTKVEFLRVRSFPARMVFHERRQELSSRSMHVPRQFVEQGSEVELEEKEKVTGGWMLSRGSSEVSAYNGETSPRSREGIKGHYPRQ